MTEQTKNRAPELGRTVGEAPELGRTVGEAPELGRTAGTRFQKQTAIYMRVSTGQQIYDSQEADLRAWAGDKPDIVWFTDKSTGKHFDRPGWKALWDNILTGRIEKIVVWRLDRLGRTASGLCQLFDDLIAAGVGLLSLRDAIDLSTASGRLMANMLASVAAFETEIRSERVRAGQAAARARGKTWGGWTAGRRRTITDDKVKAIIEMVQTGRGVSAIARMLGVSKTTIYSAIKAHGAAKPEVPEPGRTDYNDDDDNFGPMPVSEQAMADAIDPTFFEAPEPGRTTGTEQNEAEDQPHSTS